MKLNETNYIERDVSWMYFNRRILDEAQRSDILHVFAPKSLAIACAISMSKPHRHDNGRDLRHDGVALTCAPFFMP